MGMSGALRFPGTRLRTVLGKLPPCLIIRGDGGGEAAMIFDFSHSSFKLATKLE